MRIIEAIPSIDDRTWMLDFYNGVLDTEVKLDMQRAYNEGPLSRVTECPHCGDMQTVLVKPGDPCQFCGKPIEGPGKVVFGGGK